MIVKRKITLKTSLHQTNNGKKKLTRKKKKLRFSSFISSHVNRQKKKYTTIFYITFLTFVGDSLIPLGPFAFESKNSPGAREQWVGRTGWSGGASEGSGIRTKGKSAMNSRHSASLHSHN